MFDRFASQFQTVARRCRSKPMLPASILLILVGFGVFAEIAEDVGERESHGFDRSILIAMRDSMNPPNPWGSEVAVQIIRDITSLGGFTVLTGLTLASIGAAFFLGKRRLAALTAVAIAGCAPKGDLRIVGDASVIGAVVKIDGRLVAPKMKLDTLETAILARGRGAAWEWSGEG